MFLWENFGPLHIDRCEAVAKAMPERPIVGLEVLIKSSEYDWNSENGETFKKFTIYKSNAPSSWSPFRIISAALKLRPHAMFFCHYQRTSILISALVLRAFGVKIFTMNDSKFDDYSRDVWRELGKSFFFTPYQGALVASQRSADYLNFLGMSRDKIAFGYDAISTARIRTMGGTSPAPGGVDFHERHFTIVARLLPKKNIAAALRAFALLVRNGSKRKLVICGSGPLEAELKRQASELGVSDNVDFKGFLQTADICKTLAASLALILPSTEEQFGQVIPEALSLGVPVLVSDNCGARDHLVRTGVNGFIFEPFNVDGLAFLMDQLSSNEATWKHMSAAASRMSDLGDVRHFVEGVRALLGETTFEFQ